MHHGAPTLWLLSLLAATAPLAIEAGCARPMVAEPAAQAAEGAVPPEYVELYGLLESWLQSFEEPVEKRPPRGAARPKFGVHLLVADSNRGPLLLRSGEMVGVELTLDRFLDMGVKGISLAIGYPLLVDGFPDASRYLEFYKQVAGAVRERGMSLAVEQIIVFNRSVFSPFDLNFEGLTMADFVAAERQMAQTIIDELSPDYLTIIHEPDTFAVLTGLAEFNEPSAAIAFVTDIAGSLDRRSTLVGAGTGTWSPLAYVEGFAATTVDYIDLHLYWTYPQAIQDAYAMVDIANRHGKRIIIGEAWLYKSNGNGFEGTASLRSWETGFRRDVFSFWAPLDIRFHTALVKFAESTGADYVSPFWTNYYFAYVDYSPKTKDQGYARLVREIAPSKVSTAILRRERSILGDHYARIIQMSPQ